MTKRGLMQFLMVVFHSVILFGRTEDLVACGALVLGALIFVFDSIWRRGEKAIRCLAVMFLLVISVIVSTHAGETYYPVIFLVGLGMVVVRGIEPIILRKHLKVTSSIWLLLALISFYYSVRYAGLPVLDIPCGIAILLIAWFQLQPELADVQGLAFANAVAVLLLILGIGLGLSRALAQGTLQGLWYVDEHYGSLFQSDSDSGRKQGFVKPEDSTKLGLAPPKPQGKRVVRAFVKLQGSHRSLKDLYLRETAFDHFDGAAWISTGNQLIGTDDGDDGKDDGWVDIKEAYRHRAMEYEVTLPMRSRRTLVMPGLNAISTPMLTIGANDTIFLPQSTLENISYKAVSAPIFYRQLRNGRVRIERDERRYLQLPDTTLVSRIRSYTNRLTNGTRSSQEAIERILYDLRLSFNYKKNPTAPAGKNLENFFFGRKEGHCSLYATACVLMLRSRRIPARIAVGYLSKTWDTKNQVHVFSNTDRHAWVEIHLQEYGWVTLDPTPGSGRPASGVVRSDYGTVAQTATNLGQRETGRAPTGVRLALRIQDFVLTRGHYLLAFILILVALFVQFVRHRRAAKEATASAVNHPLTNFYEIFCHHFATLGVRKFPGNTGREYLRRLKHRGLVNGKFDDMIDYYYAVTYEGEEPVEATEEAFLTRIKSHARAQDSGSN